MRFSLPGVHAGLKKEGALDFSLVVSDVDCVAAGVFTRNKVKAAPVLLDMERVASNPGSIRAVATNTISANACTGSIGLANARATSDMVADALDISAEQVLVMSTGSQARTWREKNARGVSFQNQSRARDWRPAPPPS